MTFLTWSVLLCLIKKEMVSLSRTVRSEMVGLMAGSNLEEVVSSAHLKNPKKAKINMVSSVRAILGGW